jgi:hypothetical protein
VTQPLVDGPRAATRDAATRDAATRDAATRDAATGGATSQDASTRHVEIDGQPVTRLRVGVLLESLRVPAWAWTAMQELSTSAVARLIAVATLAPNGSSRPGPRDTARRIVERIDALADRPIAADLDAFAMRDATPLLAGVPVLTMRRVETEAEGTFAKDDVAALEALNLDVLLWFGGGQLRGDILRAARLGAWAFEHGDDRVKRGGPTAFWEVHEGWPVIGASLKILTGAVDRDRTVARISIATIPTSVRRTRNALAWTALPMLDRSLRRLAVEGRTAFLERIDAVEMAPAFYSNRLFRSPTLADLAVHAARRTGRVAALLARTALSRRQWTLFLGVADDLIEACWRLRPLPPPAEAFWADPHIVQFGDRYLVFIEEVMYASGKGHISVIEVDSAGRASPARTVLEEPYHLSNPFVIEDDGAYYMIPESSGNATVDLYRATSFPDRWTFVEHLLTDINAVDGTLLRAHDRWWLFANVTRHPGASDGQLELYSSDRLVGGEWRLHPASPLSTDVRGSRPAGAILRRNGRLYRPGQDGSGTYGRAIALYEILELTDTTYREQLVTSIEPNWHDRIRRTHTLAHVGRLTVLDALWLRNRWTLRRSRGPADKRNPIAG